MSFYTTTVYTEKFTNSDIKLIADALKSNNSIEQLILHTNSFNEKGAGYLRELVKEDSTNSTLMTIDVSNNWGIGTSQFIERPTAPTKIKKSDEEEDLTTKFGHK